MTDMPIKKSVKKRKPKKKRSFGRFLKRLFIFVFIIILLVVAAFSVAYFTMDPQVLVSKVSEILKERYNREIEVSAVNFSLIKGITLNGVDLSYRGGFSSGSALNLKEAAILYNPVALLLGELDIIKIRVTGFYTTYENIMSIARDFARDSGGEPKKEEESKKKKGTGIFRMKIRAVEIDDAQFVYNNVPLNIKALITPKKVLEESAVKASIFSMYGKIDFDGTLERLNIHATDLQADKFSSGIKDVRIDNVYLTLIKESDNRYTVIGKNLNAHAMGYDISTFTRFEGSYGIKGKTVLLYNFGVKVNQAQLYLDRLSYYIRNQHFSVNITNIQAKLSDFAPGIQGNITGKLDIERGKGMYISGDLDVEDFRYKFIHDGSLDINLKDNHLAGLVKLDTSGGKMELSARSEDVLNSPTVLVLNSEKFDLSPIILNFKSGSGKQDSDGGETEEKTPSPKRSALKLPPLMFKAKIGELSFKEYSLDNVSLLARLQRGDFELESFSLNFIGGKLNGSGTFNGRTFNGKIDYRDGNLRKFSEKYLSGGKKLYGRVNAFSKFRVNIADPLASIMQFELNLSGGEVINFIIMEEINKLLHFIPADNIQYDKIQASVDMRDGGLKIKKLDFLSTDLTMTSSGIVDLRKKSQDVDLKISIHKRYLEGAGILVGLVPGEKDGDYIHNRVHVSGSFDKPRVKLNK